MPKDVLSRARGRRRLVGVKLSQDLRDKEILLIVGGGIAVYKSLDLVRRLRALGARVRVVMTAAAKEFVSPLAFVSLTNEAVHETLFSATDEQEMGHIQLSRRADLIVVAPATAHLLARAANGLCDDLATTLLLATDKRIVFAPAMNVRMWTHPATQKNIETLRSQGAFIVGPAEGEMACGEFGPGRMSDVEDIVAKIISACMQETRLPLPKGVQQRSQAHGNDLTGRHIVITSGPTHEAIDPVRYIANRSSGRQGHALAHAAVAAGARVTLITGPVTLADPPACEVIHVESATQMSAAVEQALPADVFIGVAAVADWRVLQADQKIKKEPGGSAPVFTLVENPDILASVAKSQNRPALVIGFAAETQNLIDSARKKLIAKGCDMIVANDVGEGSEVFGGANNEAHIIMRDSLQSWPKMDKMTLATKLIALIGQRLSPVGADP